MADAATVTCPLCAELVGVKVKKCVHCGANLKKQTAGPSDVLTATIEPADSAASIPAGFALVGALAGFVAAAPMVTGWRASVGVVLGAVLGLAAWLALEQVDRKDAEPESAAEDEAEAVVEAEPEAEAEAEAEPEPASESPPEPAAPEEPPPEEPPPADPPA